jgi:hypothetical protein
MAAKTPTTPSPAGKISRDDLEQRFRALQSGMQGKVEEKKPSLLAIAAAGGAVVLLLVFLLGKRSGKKKTTLVEIRRF